MAKKEPGTETITTTAGKGGETHQTAGKADETLTTQVGIPVADDQNSLRAGPRGPTLLEDFHLREKITHFDHERIPERIVHARGSGAHGTFTASKSWANLTRAGFLSQAGKKTPVFVRFSTVAGGAGSIDTPRDVRGFAVKFYTDEGNFDLVGNNIPVFFIQDAIKFPDLVHAVKMEPDRGFPQAATAHDTFWDFVSLMPESMHMLMWAMSDRTIPRTLRMIEGFGVHTFRMVNAQGQATLVKFHWRPRLGMASTLWDEAVKIAGADPDFQRRDLWTAIDRGDFPAWDLAVQAFDEATAAKLGYDVLDATKLIPEEVVPLQVLGTMVLDRNPDNFFAETEQVAFHPGNLVPGIDVTEDPLLQGRLFSYLDTQLLRLGGPNFNQIPVNQPRCPIRHFQRDGHMQQSVPKGRVAYEPSSLERGAREAPERGYQSHPSGEMGPKLRVRSETFADHYSQARLFYRSMTPPEKTSIVRAFAFELGKVETVAVRKRMLGHLQIIDPELGTRVATAMNMAGMADSITPARAPVDMPPSPALSILAKHKPTLEGRKVGLLVADGTDAGTVEALRGAVEKAGARVEVIAPKIGGARSDGAGGKTIAPDQFLSGSPSVLYDAVVLAPGEAGVASLLNDAAAIDFVRDAFGHLKVIGVVAAARPLLTKAGVTPDAGVIAVDGGDGIGAFIAAAQKGRVWERDDKVRPPV